MKVFVCLYDFTECYEGYSEPEAVFDSLEKAQDYVTKNSRSFAKIHIQEMEVL